MQITHYFRERHILLTLFYVNELSGGFFFFFTIPYLGLFCQYKNTGAMNMLIKSTKKWTSTVPHHGIQNSEHHFSFLNHDLIPLIKG